MLSEKFNWDKYQFQIIGALLLVIAFVSAIVTDNWLPWIPLVAVGGIDLYIIYVLKQRTITKWIRSLTKKHWDRIIMFGLIGVCWWLKGEVVALWFALGLINNHLFEKEE